MCFCTLLFIIMRETIKFLPQVFLPLHFLAHGRITLLHPFWSPNGHNWPWTVKHELSGMSLPRGGFKSHLVRHCAFSLCSDPWSTCRDAACSGLCSWVTAVSLPTLRAGFVEWARKSCPGKPVSYRDQHGSVVYPRTPQTMVLGANPAHHLFL